LLVWQELFYYEFAKGYDKIEINSFKNCSWDRLGIMGGLFDGSA
jgi:hypothetical protein